MRHPPSRHNGDSHFLDAAAVDGLEMLCAGDEDGGNQMAKTLKQVSGGEEDRREKGKKEEREETEGEGRREKGTGRRERKGRRKREGKKGEGDFIKDVYFYPHTINLESAYWSSYFLTPPPLTPPPPPSLHVPSPLTHLCFSGERIATMTVSMFLRSSASCHTAGSASVLSWSHT